MPSDPLILAFDTSAAHCAAALLFGDRIVVSRAETMTRGQAERLMPLLQEVLAEGGITWRDLTAIGVGIGPGNFTGIRISVSAARGLALGLDIPAVGVGGCEARALAAPKGTWPAVPAPRDMVYQCDPETPGNTPDLIALGDARTRAQARDLRLQTEIGGADLAVAIARICADRWQQTTLPPAPLYARAADAAPSPDTGPVMLD